MSPGLGETLGSGIQGEVGDSKGLFWNDQQLAKARTPVVASSGRTLAVACLVRILEVACLARTPVE
eukprot:6456679-Amphidinium_carterae.3